MKYLYTLDNYSKPFNEKNYRLELGLHEDTAAEVWDNHKQTYEICGFTNVHFKFLISENKAHPNLMWKLILPW